MSTFTPLRSYPHKTGYKAGDVLVVFGEIFSRGYVNGLVEEAERAGLKVIRTTVGRREEGLLRPLNAEELASQPKPFINIALEAGFDMEPCSIDGSTPVGQLAGIKLSEWEQAKLDWKKVEESRRLADARFQTQVAKYLVELDALIPKGANVIFAHTMAGGVPRAKIVMPMMNRVFKGVGDRHLPSEKFWESEIGRLCAMNFEDVTANTFSHLIELSSSLREKIEKNGGTTRYLAYGYHGTEVIINGEYRWQSYAPYVQGWAKLKLEDTAKSAVKKGIKATVYNCPEILTNSSSIFVGVEVPLYPFITALKKEGSGKKQIETTIAKCKDLLKPEFSLADVQNLTDKTIMSPELRAQSIYEKWPQHNTKAQMETLIAAAESLVDMHKDPKNLITFVLSEDIFRATGTVMFNDSWQTQGPVMWLGHDVLAKTLAQERTI